MNAQRRRQRNRLLLEQDGKCCYCGVRLRLTVPVPGERVPPDSCTFEHPYPKGDPRRVPDGDYTLKLACYRCNNKRGVEHGKELMRLANAIPPWQTVRWHTEGNPSHETIPT